MSDTVDATDTSDTADAYPETQGSPAEASRISVCIVDDDPFVTASLHTILAAEPDLVVVGEAGDGAQAIALFEQAHPDVLLMDIQMPSIDGLAAAERILADHPSARIVLLTTFSDDEYIVRALRLGAKGYLIKQEVSTIAPALRSVMAGQSVLGEEVLGRVDALMQGVRTLDTPAAKGDVQNSLAHATMLSQLSDREKAIVELVAEGHDNKGIAAILYIGEGTVRNHISAILQKLSLKNRTQLAIAYYRAR